jgi:2-keto-4-pentenoate hydratase/2-oxohepta-3-ene-1,7-dioic acid hydratase in catechol pathway
MAERSEHRGEVASLGHRLANLRSEAGYTLGAEVEDGILDVPATAAALGLPAPQDMDALLQEGGADAVSAVIAAARHEPERAVTVAVEDAPFAPLVTRPGKIVCVGFNYQHHAEETNTTVGEVPALFSKYTSTLNHHNGTVELPTRVAAWFDFETELVMVIGRTARDVSERQALDHVAGYATGNDFSARDLQTATSQFLAGKNSDGFGPLGPWLVPASRVPDPNALGLKTYVNGVLRQDWNTDDMIFNCASLIRYISSLFTLSPGDVIFTGTPQGVIFGEKRPPAERDWLKAGDEVISEVAGLGELRFTLV